MPSKHRRPPTKPELARFKAMADLGQTANAIGRQTGRDPKTVRKWLNSEVYQTDQDLQDLVALVKTRELDDLTLLGAKARQRLHELLDSGKTRMIETIACMDRSFQQRRLLEGSSTANIGLLTKLIGDAHATLFQDNARPPSEHQNGPASSAEDS